MRTRILGGTGAVALALVLTGCSSSSASPTTTTTTSTTVAAATTTSGASTAQELAAKTAEALMGGSASKFCVSYAVESQVSSCTSDISSSGVTFKDWKVGAVTVQGDQAVITFTGTTCQGSTCVSNSDPNAATDPESAAYAGSSFAETFATANNPNSENGSPFVAAAVQQNGAWYASGF